MNETIAPDDDHFAAELVRYKLSFDICMNGLSTRLHSWQRGCVWSSKLKPAWNGVAITRIRFRRAVEMSDKPDEPVH